MDKWQWHTKPVGGISPAFRAIIVKSGAKDVTNMQKAVVGDGISTNVLGFSRDKLKNSAPLGKLEEPGRV